MTKVSSLTKYPGPTPVGQSHRLLPCAAGATEPKFGVGTANAADRNAPNWSSVTGIGLAGAAGAEPVGCKSVVGGFGLNGAGAIGLGTVVVETAVGGAVSGLDGCIGRPLTALAPLGGACWLVSARSFSSKSGPGVYPARANCGPLLRSDCHSTLGNLKGPAHKGTRTRNPDQSSHTRMLERYGEMFRMF